MTEAPTLGQSDDDSADRRASDGRGLWNVLAIAAVVIIVILTLLMLRGCSGIINAANHASATNQIIAVPGGQPVSGKVSVWLTPGASITQVLAASGLTGSAVDMGSGRFVIDVPTGDEIEVVRKLRDDKLVYDAGRVYQNTK
jgi:hypothetical protein